MNVHLIVYKILIIIQNQIFKTQRKRTMNYRQPGTIKLTNPTPPESSFYPVYPPSPIPLSRQSYLQNPHTYTQTQQNYLGSSFCGKKQSSCSVSLNFTSMGLHAIPVQFDDVQCEDVVELIMDGNCIREGVIDGRKFGGLERLSVRGNRMEKFSVKKMLSFTYETRLLNLNLSNNNLKFVDLSIFTNLKHLDLSHNALQTTILPQPCLQILNLSHNSLSNIQYSALNSKLFPHLSYLNVSHNNKSLYDLILSINNEYLVPQLKQLYCSNNVITYIEGIGSKVEIFDISDNCMVFDRAVVKEVCAMKGLRELRIGGNVVGRGVVEMIRGKIGERVRIYGGGGEAGIKESPYRIYGDNGMDIKGGHKVASSNFTLGQEIVFQTDKDQQNIDPEYNLMQQTPTLAKYYKGINTIEEEETKNHKQLSYHQIYHQPQLPQPQLSQQQQQQQKTLNQIKSKLTPQFYKLKIQGKRYHNHYRHYLTQLSHFMIVPPYPILHQSRNTDISLRIDPSSDPQYINEYQLINQMFKARGGVHYIRKVYNWNKTQNIREAVLVFVNLEIGKEEFEKMCEGSYGMVQDGVKMKHCVNLQPSSFSVYHVLARVSCGIDPVNWSCFYLIEAVHL